MNCELCGREATRLYALSDRLPTPRPPHHVCRGGCGKYYHSLRVCVGCLGPTTEPAGMLYPLPKEKAA